MKILLTLLVLFSESRTAFSEEVKLLVASAPAETFVAGKSVYEKYCIKCHAPANIMVSSPKFGDQIDWQKRLENDKGLKAMIQFAMKGKNAMPKKGMCIECKEQDLKAAILYMIRGEK